MLLGPGWLLLPLLFFWCMDWLFNFTLLMAQSGYLHLLRDWYRCFSSFCNCPGVEQTVLALWKHGAYHTVFRCYSMVAISVKILVCVGFFSVDRGVKSAIFIWSDKHIQEGCGSIFIWIFTGEVDVNMLRCCKKVSLCDLWMMMKVSSTNLFQRVGGVGAVDSALIS